MIKVQQSTSGKKGVEKLCFAKRQHFFTIELMNQFRYSWPPDHIKEIFSIAIPREIDDESPSQDCVEIHVSPETAVLAIVAVISHNK